MPYSIVVPARNEAETIGAVLSKVCQMTDDLLVIDGHSTDRTAEIAKEFGARVIRDNGRGNGDAIRVALKAVVHPITVFIDAGGSHDPNEIPTREYRRQCGTSKINVMKVAHRYVYNLLCGVLSRRKTSPLPQKTASTAASSSAS